MKNELAKHLKYAGYKGTDFTIWKSPRGEFLPYPTLSELIEACGNKFQEMVRGSKFWWCWYYNKEDEWKAVKGNTPEEAVAELWLELNRNNEVI